MNVSACSETAHVEESGQLISSDPLAYMRQIEGCLDDLQNHGKYSTGRI